jgi:predicted transcriptional regulator
MLWLRAVDASSMDELFAPDGLTRRHWQLLSTVQRNQPASTSDVEEAMATPTGEAAQSPQSLLRALRERGWVQSSAAGWSLTDDGGAVHARLQAKVADHRTRMFATSVMPLTRRRLRPWLRSR